MSGDHQHSPVESDLTPACREMIAQLARQAHERRRRTAAGAGLAQRAEEQKAHEP